MPDCKVDAIYQSHQISFKCILVLQAYIRQMAACLAQLTDTLLTEQSSSPAMQRLSELAIECGSLVVITLVSNPKGFKDLQNCNMEERIVCPDAQPPSFYCEVLVIFEICQANVASSLHDMRCRLSSMCSAVHVNVHVANRFLMNHLIHFHYNAANNFRIYTDTALCVGGHATH